MCRWRSVWRATRGGRGAGGCRRWRFMGRARGWWCRRWRRGSPHSTGCGSPRMAGGWWRSGAMKFDELDERMRVFETAHDVCVLPGIRIVARLDGRNFTRLTKETLQLERPFDVRFRDYMIATVEHLMECGFRILYGYTQSDEISLLFHPEEVGFGRKERKLNSVL